MSRGEGCGGMSRGRGCLGGVGMSRDVGAGGGYIMGPGITAHQY